MGGEPVGVRGEPCPSETAFAAAAATAVGVRSGAGRAAGIGCDPVVAVLGDGIGCEPVVRAAGGAFTADSVLRGSAGSGILVVAACTREVASPAEIGARAPGRGGGTGGVAPDGVTLGWAVAPVMRAWSRGGRPPGRLFASASRWGAVMWMTFPHLHLMRYTRPGVGSSTLAKRFPHCSHVNFTVFLRARTRCRRLGSPGRDA
jgi:hypothetical protein